MYSIFICPTVLRYHYRTIRAVGVAKRLPIYLPHLTTRNIVWLYNLYIYTVYIIYVYNLYIYIIYIYNLYIYNLYIYNLYIYIYTLYCSIYWWFPSRVASPLLMALAGGHFSFTGVAWHGRWVEISGFWGTKESPKSSECHFWGFSLETLYITVLYWDEFWTGNIIDWILFFSFRMLLCGYGHVFVNHFFAPAMPRLRLPKHFAERFNRNFSEVTRSILKAGVGVGADSCQLGC